MISQLTAAHLAPGHAAGPQTHRRLRSRVWGVLTCTGFAVFFAVIGAVAAQHPGKASSGVFYGVFGGMALVMLAFATLIWVTSRPKRTGAFAVSTETVELRRGDTVKVRLQVSSPGEDELEVGVVCTQFYDKREVQYNAQTGTTHRRVIRSAPAYEKWTKADPARPLQDFTFQLPPDGPFSHEGQVLSLAWEIRARRPVRARRDPTSVQPIWVRP